MNTTHVKLSPAVLLTFVLLLCNLSAIARPQRGTCSRELGPYPNRDQEDRWYCLSGHYDKEGDE